MKNSKKTNLYCALFGHNYKVTKSITHHVKEYKCCNCKSELTTNGNGKLTELTPKFKEINETLSRIYANKLARMQAKRYQNTTAA